MNVTPRPDESHRIDNQQGGSSSQQHTSQTAVLSTSSGHDVVRGNVDGVSEQHRGKEARRSAAIGKENDWNALPPGAPNALVLSADHQDTPQPTSVSDIGGKSTPHSTGPVLELQPPPVTPTFGIPAKRVNLSLSEQAKQAPSAKKSCPTAPVNVQDLPVGSAVDQAQDLVKKVVCLLFLIQELNNLILIPGHMDIS
jgi:hypothetical protein